MDQFIWENGGTITTTEKASTFIQMAKDTKDSYRMGKGMALARCFILMAISIKAAGNKAKRMVLESKFTQMEKNTQANG